MECTLYIVYNIYIYKLLAYQELEFLVHSLLQSSVIQLQLQTVIVSSDTGNIVQIQQQREIVRQLDRDSCSQLQQKQYTHTHIVDRYIQQIVERERQRHRYSTSSTIKRRCIYSFVSFLLFLLFQSFLVGRLNSREIRIRNTYVKTKRQLHLQLRLHSYTQH